MKKPETTTWRIEDGIGILTLNNPPENYLMKPEFVGLELMKSRIDGTGIRGLLITGEGRHFSAGADLDSLGALSEDPRLLLQEMEKGKDLLSWIDDLKIPVVAAVRGVCFGGGFEIALACDIRVCSTNALFAFPETGHGIMPGLGGTAFLELNSDDAIATEMILGGEMINAEKALKHHIVSYVVNTRELKQFSLELLHKLTNGKDIKVINSVMQALKNTRSLPIAEAMKEETRMFCELAIRAT